MTRQDLEQLAQEETIGWQVHNTIPGVEAIEIYQVGFKKALESAFTILNNRKNDYDAITDLYQQLGEIV